MIYMWECRIRSVYVLPHHVNNNQLQRSTSYTYVIDKIQIIKELLCVKYGLVSLPCFSDSFYARVTVYTQQLFLPTFYLYFLYDLNIYIGLM